MLSTALLVLLTATSAPDSWRLDTGSSPEVHLNIVNGSIQVEAIEGGTVSVEARGDEGAQAEPLVNVSHEGNAVEVQVCCGSCGDQVKDFDCRSARAVHLVVKVPRAASLELSSVGAPVKVVGVAGSLEVSTVNGAVTLSGSRGRTEVSTVGGRVELMPEALERLEVSTVSGDVKLKMPRDANARVEFASVGGRFNGRRVPLGFGTKQLVGEGANPVMVSTVSGSFDLQ